MVFSRRPRAMEDRQPHTTVLVVSDPRYPHRIEIELSFRPSSVDHRKEQWDGYCISGLTLCVSFFSQRLSHRTIACTLPYGRATSQRYFKALKVSSLRLSLTPMRSAGRSRWSQCFTLLDPIRKAFRACGLRFSATGGPAYGWQVSGFRLPALPMSRY